LALFWQWISALAIATWTIFSHHPLTPAALMLPIRTSASIPFVVLALLTLMMRQVKREKTFGSQGAESGERERISF
jgi:hypothetical protein